MKLGVKLRESGQNMKAFKCFREAFGENSEKVETQEHLFEVYFDNKIFDVTSKKNIKEKTIIKFIVYVCEYLDNVNERDIFHCKI